MPKKAAWGETKLQKDNVPKKTSIGNSRLSGGAGTNKNKTKKKYRGHGK